MFIATLSEKNTYSAGLLKKQQNSQPIKVFEILSNGEKKPEKNLKNQKKKKTPQRQPQKTKQKDSPNKKSFNSRVSMIVYYKIVISYCIRYRIIS